MTATVIQVFLYTNIYHTYTVKRFWYVKNIRSLTIQIVGHFSIHGSRHYDYSGKVTCIQQIICTQGIRLLCMVKSGL